MDGVKLIEEAVELMASKGMEAEEVKLSSRTLQSMGCSAIELKMKVGLVVTIDETMPPDKVMIQ